VAEATAGLGWNDVAPLTWAGGPLATGLLLLGLAGGLLRSLRVWEAALLVLAAIGLLAANPGLHAPAHYPLLFVLVVFGSLAIRWLTGEVAAAGPSRQDRPPAAARLGHLTRVAPAPRGREGIHDPSRVAAAAGSATIPATWTVMFTGAEHVLGLGPLTAFGRGLAVLSPRGAAYSGSASTHAEAAGQG
jgi:hypothetical protein